jgi:hypothetical protein
VTYTTYAKWASAAATFYVNPSNADVTSAAASSAVQTALNVWSTQSGTTFHYTFGGTVSDTTTAYDNRNVLIFRNATNGTSIGTTYSWWDSNKNLLDSDIIIWDANFNFFTGTSGCGILPNAAYIEDIATHELGHALGLNHSTAADATMYPSYGYCSQSFRTLASDDIAGAKSLYPAAAQPPPNSTPSVTITSPANGATFVQGSTISFNATATDAEDGNISSQVQWTDNGVSLGSGSLLSSVLSLVGIHTIVAKVTDSAGAQATSQVSITITLLSPPTTTGTLSAMGKYNMDGTERVQLVWSGVSGVNVDVYRGTVKIKTILNSGRWTDQLGTKGPGSYSYAVCSSGTTTCTNTATVTF